MSESENNEAPAAKPKAAPKGMLKAASWMVSGGALQAASGFFANLVLMRLLMPEDFGRFALVQANVGLVQAIANLRVADAVVRLEDDELNPNRLALFWAAMLIESLVVAAGSLMFLWLADLLIMEAWVLLGGALMQPFLMMHIRLFERRLDYKRVSVLETGSVISSHGLAVVGAVLGVGPLVLYLRLWVVVLGRAIGLTVYRAWSPVRLRLPSVADWRGLIANLRGFWADGLVEQSFERVVILLVGYFAGERGAGFFFQAKRLAIVPHQLLQPLAARVSYNYFSRLPQQEAFVLLRRTLRNLGAALLVGGVLCVALADPVVPFLFGEAWRPAAVVLVAMSGVVVFITPHTILKFYAMARRRMRRFLVFGRGAQLVCFAAAVALHYIGGIDAPVALAWGLSAGYTVGAITMYGYEATR